MRWVTLYVTWTEPKTASKSPISNILPCIGNSDEASMAPQLIPFRFMLAIGGRAGSWFGFVRRYSGGEERGEEGRLANPFGPNCTCHHRP